ERGQECDDAGGLSGPGAARIAARLRPRLEGGEERARVLEVEGQELESVEFLARERAGHARGRGVERRRVDAAPPLDLVHLVDIARGETRHRNAALARVPAPHVGEAVEPEGHVLGDADAPADGSLLRGCGLLGAGENTAARRRQACEDRYGPRPQPYSEETPVGTTGGGCGCRYERGPGGSRQAHGARSRDQIGRAHVCTPGT